MDPDDFTIASLGRLLRDGDLTATDLTEGYLARIAALDGELGSFITVDPDGARAQAAAADADFAAGVDRGPLQGLPIGFKDNIAVAGLPCTSGADVYRDHVPSDDSTVAARLRAGGAVILGKHNMHELGLGGTTQNPFYGDCHNPWSLDHIPGGSSGGGAAAAAANLSVVSIANDGAGSARNPAALCGVVGMKPTHGLVSRAGFMPRTQGYSHVDCGVIGRSVDDVATTLQVVAGADPADPVTGHRPPLDLASTPSDPAAMTVAVDPYFTELVDDDVLALFESAVGTLQDLGVKVRTIDVAELRHVETAIWTTIRVERAQANRPLLVRSPERFTPYNRHALIADHFVPGTYYVRAQRLRRAIRSAVATAMEGIDALVAPSVPVLAPSVERIRQFQVELNDGLHPIGTPDGGTILTRNSTLCNVTGTPAITVPSGLSASGLPAGIQFIGHAWSEPTLLSLAGALEGAGCGPLRPAFGWETPA